MRKAIIKGFALLAIAVLLGTIPMGAHAEERRHKVEFGKVYSGSTTDISNFDIFYFDVQANQTIVISVTSQEKYFTIYLDFGNMWNHVKFWFMDNYYPKVTNQFVNLYYNVTAEDVKKYGDGKTVRAYIYASAGSAEGESGVVAYKIKFNLYDKGLGAANTLMLAIMIAGIVLVAVVAIVVALWRKKK